VRMASRLTKSTNFMLQVSFALMAIVTQRRLGRGGDGDSGRARSRAGAGNVCS
jgi:hypothetical protein